MKRENGFYWVKRKDEWTIAEYSNGGWWLIGWEFSEADSFFQEINENRIKNPNNLNKVIDSPLNEFVEVKSIYEESNTYPDWTKVTRFLACGLQGVEVREITNYR